MLLSASSLPTPRPLPAVGDELCAFLSGCRVLVLEDEVMIAVALEDALLEAGAEVVFARTLRRGLAAMSESVFDAALLDVTLGPRTTCWPVAKALRARGVPFLVHTGDLDRCGEFVNGIGAPVLPKPAAATDVVRRLAAVIRD